MSTLTIRLKTESDRKMIQKLMKHYGLTQSSKALVAAGHDAVERIPRLIEQNNDLNEETRILSRLLRELTNSHEAIESQKKRYSAMMRDAFIELNKE